MKKREDGYILAYVLVVIVLLCALAAAVCSIALRNYKAQQASVERTQQVYAAEGLIEQFVAEVQDRAKGLSGENQTAPYTYENVQQAFEELLDSSTGIKIDGLSVATYQYDSELDGWTEETESAGTHYLLPVSVQAVAGDVAVSAVIQMAPTFYIAAVTDEETAITTYSYSVAELTLTYESYTVGASETAEGGGAS